MGYDKYTQLGVYIKIPKVIKGIQVEYYVDSEGRETPYKFNPETGQENQLKYRKENKEQRISAYIDDDNSLIEDMFFSPEFLEVDNSVIFLLNKHDKTFVIETEEVGLTQLPETMNIPSLIQMFKEEYKEYLDYYENKYDNLEIGFGLINYVM